MKGMGLNRGIDFTHTSELCSLDCIILHGSHCPLSMEHQMVRLMMIAKQTVTNHEVTKLQTETRRPILMTGNSTPFPPIRNTVWAGAATLQPHGQVPVPQWSTHSRAGSWSTLK